MSSAALAALACLCASAVARASDRAGQELVDAALQRGDECDSGAEGGEQCALAALQLRGRQESKGVAQRAGAPAVDFGNSSCDATAVGGMMKDRVPACVEACPRLCAAATPLLALVNAGGAMDMACEREADLSCAMKGRNAEACGPMLAELAAAWPGMPKTAESLAAACGPLRAGGGSLLGVEASTARALMARASAGDGAAGRRMLDLSVSHKEADPNCADAREGQTCVPPADEQVHSRAYIYCSAKKRLSSGATDCYAQKGALSRCVGGGFGLTHDYCDDPFCRNGGADAGEGLYCHDGDVARCANHDDPPSVYEACDDEKVTTRRHCEVTIKRECRGRHPHPFCARTGVQDKKCDGEALLDRARGGGLEDGGEGRA